ncbi:MAG: substrate-binding periplasmic protein [Pseudomonadales bacterium]
MTKHPLRKLLPLCLFCLSTPTIATPLKLMTDTFFPFSYQEQGMAKGVNIDVVQLIAKRMALDIELEFMPWQRAYRDLTNNERHALFPVIYTAERSQHLSFACSIGIDTTYLYVRQSAAVKPKTLEEAKDMRSIAQAGSYQSQLLIENGFSNLTTVSSNQQIFDMLNKARFEVVALGESAYTSIQENTTEQLISTGIRLFETKYCIAFPKNYPQAEITQWQEHLTQIHAEGTYAEILERYKQ